MTKTIGLSVNRRHVALEIEDRILLSDALRDRLHLKSVHVGCDLGSCGACSVLVEGRSALACLTFAVQCDGLAVTTLEGLERDQRTIALKAKLSDHHALQCGYCTPGVIISAMSLLDSPHRPTSRDDIRAAIDGNLCRCTGYFNIVDAVEEWLGETP